VATFCLLHGKWHDGGCWDPLVVELERRGHRCVAPDLPFGDPAAGHEQRARPALEALGGAAEPVVVVGHSLSAGIAAIVAAHAGASLVVYLCPAPTGPFGGLGIEVRQIREGFPFPPDREDGTSAWEPDAAIAAMYPRLPPDSARVLAARLRPASTNPDAYPLDAHPDIPSLLVLATEDEFFEPEWSRRAARAALGSRAVEMETGHFPMIESPGELAAVLERGVRECASATA
jgi:pimeloyl-ACP methyl ester carboxylesterase